MQNYVQTAIDNLKEAEKSLEKELQEVRDALASLTGKIKLKAGSVKSSKYIDYSKEWTMVRKYLYILEKENRFISFREIADIIVGIEGLTNVNIGKFGGDISNNVQYLKKDGSLVKYQVGKSYQNTFWGVPTWLDANGNIIKGHEYNEKYLTGTAKEGLPLTFTL